MNKILILLIITLAIAKSDTIIFEDDFDTLDYTKWKHEITMGGGGNWEFEMYINNRSVSYATNSCLYISP